MTSPPALLILGWGNRSRGDDALGPLFVERLQAWTSAGGPGEQVAEFIEDYQLQPEHALDLCGRSHVLFVDASLVCEPPCELRRVAAHRDHSFSSHALSPQALLQVFRDIHHTEPPECSLLAIRGEFFDLGAAPGRSALQHLELALEQGRRWLLERVAARPDQST